MKTKNIDTQEVSMARRSFLRYAGAGLAAAGMLGAAACHKANPVVATGLDIGIGDTGILNYAYALEQLEAAFYIQVVATPYSGITATETARLTDIRDHEVAHREFLKATLGTSQAIPALTPDFSSINFGTRASVLAAAQAFEDLGVQAYNGAGFLIESGIYLGIAGKIVSVEARHASYIRDLITPGSFGDTTILDVNGMDQSKTIAQVLPIANTFLKTKVNASNFGYVAS